MGSGSQVETRAGGGARGRRRAVGPYRIESRLGEGGTALVYKAVGPDGQERLSFEPSTLDGRDAFEWTFRVGSSRRIDIFLVVGSDGYAVLGQVSGFDSVIRTARCVAGSIQPRGQ